ncbi:MAG: hypothetical protein OHK0029_12620 [Armatimonadaceae bacterium]
MSTFFGKLNKSEQTKPSSGGDAESNDETFPVSIPLYVAGGAVQISALVAVAYQVAEPAFAYFTIALTILGMVVSYNLRRIGISSRLIFAGTILLGLIFLYALRGAGVFGAIIPLEVQGSQEILLISALAYTATFSSFLLLTDEAVVFTCVWAIAIIGLTGTVNINRELVLCFIAFLAASSFLLIHQNTLHQSAANRARWPQRFQRWRSLHGETVDEQTGQRRLLRTQLTMAGIAWFVSLALGFLIAIPVQMVGRNLSINQIVQRLKVPPSAASRAGVLPRLTFDDATKFDVGIGPIDDDPTEKMTVLTEEPQYWRGRVYNQYTGKGWRNTLADFVEEIVPVPGGDTAEGFSTFELKPVVELPPTVEKQTHRFNIRGGLYGPIYHAAEPRVVRALVSRVLQRPDNTIGTGRNGGQEYEVDSDIVRFKVSDLRDSGTDYPEDIRRRYLGQALTNDQLRALSQEAISGAGDNPYDRAQAIRTFISSRCVYTRDARAVPRDQDAAEFFLNESREGYCDLYATSMAVLCRYAGIPARVATGFAPGNPAEDWKPDNPNEKRTLYILRGSDQHAWTEVYFNGIGWIPFDATRDTVALTAPATTPMPEREETPFQKWLRTGKFAIGLVVLGLLGVMFVLYNEFYRQSPKTKAATSVLRPFASQVTRIYLGALRQTERRAFRRAVTETPMEYAQRLRRDFDTQTGESLGRLTAIAEKAFYGPSDITEADVQAANTIAAEVKHALKTQKERKNTPPSGAVSGDTHARSA